MSEQKRWSGSSEATPVRLLPPAEPGHLRVSDAEREQVAACLREAAGRGELTLTEAEERQGAAYAAVNRADLAALTTDLPPSAAPALARPATAPVRGSWEWWTSVPVAIWVALAVAVFVVAGIVADGVTGHGSFPWYLLWIPVAIVWRGSHRHHHRSHWR